MTNHLLEQIKQGCHDLQLEPTSQQLQALLDYLLLLTKWNKVYNLTSVRDTGEMITRHLFDSLAILPFLNGQSLLDVGSGGGLPGIPVAICRPELTVVLLDSNSKKTRFLQQAKAELSLDNVTVVHARVEQAEIAKFELVTARAFSTIDKIVDLAGRHCDDAGKLLLMKGMYPEDELHAAYGEFKLQAVHKLVVPSGNGDRHLVELTKNQ